MTHGEARDGLSWQAGTVPVSARYSDVYFSAIDGLAETRHVFLEGNDLPRRWAGAQGFRLAELGFGTGLGVAAALHLWRRLAAPGAVLEMTSFEIALLPREAAARALSAFPTVAEETAELLAAWPFRAPVSLPGLRLTVVHGDARRTVPAWEGQAEAWFLDGFSPARNPEMWEPALMAAVHDRTADRGTVATYSAAGAVRRALAAAGFVVLKRPGYGTKRDMTVGRRPPSS